MNVMRRSLVAEDGHADPGRTDAARRRGALCGCVSGTARSPFLSWAQSLLALGPGDLCPTYPYTRAARSAGTNRPGWEWEWACATREALRGDGGALLAVMVAHYSILRADVARWRDVCP